MIAQAGVNLEVDHDLQVGAGSGFGFREPKRAKSNILITLLSFGVALISGAIA